MRFLTVFLNGPALRTEYSNTGLQAVNVLYSCESLENLSLNFRSQFFSVFREKTTLQNIQRRDKKKKNTFSYFSHFESIYQGNK